MPKRHSNRKEANPPLSLRLGESIRKELKEAKEATGLSESDLARLAIERGLPMLVTLLSRQEAAA